jgi:2'-5' RNA ligase
VTAQDLQSALLVAIPSAEPAVARHRDRFDSSAPRGVPAHITVLFPFISPAAIDSAVHAELARLFGAVGAFRFTLDHTSWFGDSVLWLGPRDDAPFRALTRAAFAAFPEYPPYGGRHGDVVPHLTIGDHGPLPERCAAEAAVRSHLPIEGEVTEVRLMVGPPADGLWDTVAVFPLA